MPWVKLDDGFADNLKVGGLSDRAFRAHVEALCYCARNLTDGLISTPYVKRMRWTRQATELQSAKLWDVDPEGYRIHDYLLYNPSRAQVMEDREIARRRSAMNADPELARLIKARDGNACRYCGVEVNWRDRKGVRGATYDHVIPLSTGGDESFENLVTACRACNTKKGARTPERAGMTLRSVPDLDGITPQSIDKSGSPIPRPVPIPQKQEPEKKPEGARSRSTTPRARECSYEVRAEMVERFRDVASAQDVNEAIDYALSHAASKKWGDTRLGLLVWLKKETWRGANGGATGSGGVRGARAHGGAYRGGGAGGGDPAGGRAPGTRGFDSSGWAPVGAVDEPPEPVAGGESSHAGGSDRGAGVPPLGAGEVRGPSDLRVVR